VALRRGLLLVGQAGRLFFQDQGVAFRCRSGFRRRSYGWSV